MLFDQDGLVHMSELSNRYVKDASEVVKVGQIVKAQVRMPTGPLKTTGEHVVTVAPHTDVVVEVKVVVLGETD